MRQSWKLAVILWLAGLAWAATGVSHASGQITRCGDYGIEREKLEVGLQAGDPRSIDVVRFRGAGGRVAHTVAERRIEMRWCRDITGDRTPELLIEGSTSESPHCCWSYALYSMGPGIKTLLAVASGDQRLAFDDIRELGHGPAQEIVLHLNLHGAFITHEKWASITEWPTLPAILCYREGTYRDCTREHPKELQRQIERAGGELRSASGRQAADEGSIRRWALTFYGLHVLARAESEGEERLKKLVPESVRRWIERHRDEIRAFALGNADTQLEAGGSTK